MRGARAREACGERRQKEFRLANPESHVANPDSEAARCGSNSVVESQPSKLLVAGSIPVSRSSLCSRELTRHASFG